MMQILRQEKRYLIFRNLVLPDDFREVFVAFQIQLELDIPQMIFKLIYNVLKLQDLLID